MDSARCTRGSLSGSIFHSDNGGQYTVLHFGQYCEREEVICSRGRVGSSADNALAESFIASLKREVMGDSKVSVSAEATEMEVFSWIARYNNIRRYSDWEIRVPSRSRINQLSWNKLSEFLSLFRGLPDVGAHVVECFAVLFGGDRWMFWVAWSLVGIEEAGWVSKLSEWCHGYHGMVTLLGKRKSGNVVPTQWG